MTVAPIALHRPLADPAPFRLTTDRESFRRFLNRVSRVLRVPLEHPDQLTLTDALVTTDCGRRHTWPSVVSICRRLCPGLTTTVFGLAGQRRVRRPSPATAALILNACITTLFDQLEGCSVSVDDELDSGDEAAEGVVYLVSLEKNARFMRQRASALIDHVLDDADGGGLAFVRGFATPTRASVLFGQADDDSAGLAGSPVRAAAAVSPHLATYRLRWREAVTIGSVPMVGGKADDGNAHFCSRSALLGNLEPALDRTRRAVLETVPTLADIPIPGTRPDDIAPPVIAFLRGQRVTLGAAKSVAGHLCYGRFGANRDPAFADSVRLGAHARWTAADLLAAVTAAVESAGVTWAPPIVTLARVGYAIATGGVRPTFH